VEWSCYLFLPLLRRKRICRHLDVRSLYFLPITSDMLTSEIVKAAYNAEFGHQSGYQLHPLGNVWLMRQHRACTRATEMSGVIITDEVRSLIAASLFHHLASLSNGKYGFDELAKRIEHSIGRLRKEDPEHTSIIVVSCPSLGTKRRFIT
jgi:hypothetical protein